LFKKRGKMVLCHKGCKLIKGGVKWYGNQGGAKSINKKGGKTGGFQDGSG
jgi:hypothetical protein